MRDSDVVVIWNWRNYRGESKRVDEDKKIRWWKI